MVILMRQLTELEVGRAVGIDPFRMSRALCGTRPPSPELRRRITDELLADE
jgi:hypothetical protein